MNRRSLHPSQLELLRVIEELGFGRIERVHVRGGKPQFEPAPDIVQEIKLASDVEPRAQQYNNPHTKDEFERLFGELNRLGDGVVNIECRHGVPFKLAVTLCREDLLR